MRDTSHIRRHLVAQAASGLTGSAYCRREHVNVWTFRNWCKRRERYLATTAAGELPFVRVSLPASEPSDAGAALEVRLRSSATLRIPPEVDVSRLGPILKVLKRSRVLE